MRHRTHTAVLFAKPWSKVMESNHRCLHIRQVSCHWTNLRHPRAYRRQSLEGASSSVTMRWSARQGSNLRLSLCKRDTRSTELRAVNVHHDSGWTHVEILLKTSFDLEMLTRELCLESWWKGSESNRQPTLCKSVALPVELPSQNARGHARAVVGGARIELA
jgi:hypothetical protein